MFCFTDPTNPNFLQIKMQIQIKSLKIEKGLELVSRP